MRGNQRGFSLIEIIVGVAIVGMLAAIGAVNYQKAAARGKQSEAKSALASIFAAEKNYFMEFNEYVTRFDVIGFRPDGNLYYNVGFGALDKAPSATAIGMGSPAGVAACRNTCTALAALADADCSYNCGPAATCPAACVVIAGACVRRIPWTCHPSATTAIFSAGANGGQAESIQAGNANNRFRALAAGRPSRLIDDQWTINQNKVLTNVLTGL